MRPAQACDMPAASDGRAAAAPAAGALRTMRPSRALGQGQNGPLGFTVPVSQATSLLRRLSAGCTPRHGRTARALRGGGARHCSPPPGGLASALGWPVWACMKVSKARNPLHGAGRLTTRGGTKTPESQQYSNTCLRVEQTEGAQ